MIILLQTMRPQDTSTSKQPMTITATSPEDAPEIDLLARLVALPSVTPDDAGCQAVMSEHLAALGFTIEAMPFG